MPNSPTPKYTQYGNTDLQVSRICQGTAFRNMERSEENDAGLRVLEHCIDIGLNFFDTAPGYGSGGSERLLGKAIENRRDKVIIAERVLNLEYPLDAEEGKPKKPAKYNREYIFKATDWSLKRLGTDYLDILSIHLTDGLNAKRSPEAQDSYMEFHKDPNPTSPEEISDSMDALVQSGKIRYWGLSQHDSQDVKNYLRISKMTGNIPILSLQNNYSLMSRGKGTEALFPLIRNEGLGVQTIGPMAAGRLAPSAHIEPGSAAEDLIKSIDEVSKELGVKRANVCVAWVLAHPELTTALAGSESLEHVDDNVAGTLLELPKELLDKLDNASSVFKDRENPES